MNTLLLIAVVVIALFALWRFLFFFRNPSRQSSATPDAILSPADGYVLYVRYISGSDPEVFSIKNEKPVYLQELMFLRETDPQLLSGWLIGITMTPLDVHYNRSPVEGYIEKTGHEFPTSLRRNFNMFPALQNLFFGKEKPWEDCSYLVHNERASYLISNSIIKLYVTQIADRYVKKIVTFRDKENVSRGEVFGLIRMGSQVDLFIPDTYVPVRICVGEGRRVKAGIDVIARMN